ncbi:MAG: hypothetical protein JWP29_4835 [Rhodoferax sp.]|nr:hypothetical protein [Rhodoferax sp.]
MSLTKIERLILLNQYRLLATLEPTEARSYERHVKALENGFATEYGFLDRLSAELSEEDCEFVYHALNVYEGMQSSWDRLADKDGITKDSLAYHGFAGNSEGPFMSYSRYIVEDLGKYDYLLIGDHNSHRPTGVQYERMISTWRSFDSSHDMTSEQIRAVLKA